MMGGIVVPGFGDMTEDVLRELQALAPFHHEQIRAEQREIATAEQYNDRRHLKFGRLRMRISDEAYHYWGLRLGFKCWRDKQFLREYERDNPEVRLRSRPRQTTVRVGRSVGGRTDRTDRSDRTDPVILDQFGRAVCRQTQGAA